MKNQTVFAYMSPSLYGLMSKGGVFSDFERRDFLSNKKLFFKFEVQDREYNAWRDNPNILIQNNSKFINLSDTHSW